LRRGEEIWQTFTDAEGAYVFDNVRAGDYEVLVDPAALPENSVADPASHRIVLGVGETARRADVVVRKPARLEIRQGEPDRGAALVPAVAPRSRRPADRSRDCFGDSPEAGMIGFFRFPFDSDRLVETADQSAEFAQWARWLGSSATRRVVIEGHTDPVGDDPYNFGLADRRALTVYRRLVGAGAPAERIHLVAEGPDLPCDPGTGEQAWARNRRVILVVDGE
jgi:outer membrane protein OmpA-like peptidoglycan-associated protein